MTDTTIRRRTVHVNGVDLAVTEAGDVANPTVVLSHGFPEGAYSWRHQLPALAAAGYHAIAPDQRGYGHSSAPRDVSAYGIRELTGDLVGLLDDLGKDDAVWVGHDWGAMIVWEGARLHADRVRAVGGVSVPATAWPGPPTQLMRAVYQDNFFYILYFQPVGPAETELDADPFDTITKVYWGASGEGFALPTEMRPMAGQDFLTSAPTPPPLPWSWLSEADARHYADEFAHSGFFGAVSYYRNLDANYEVLKDIGLDSLTMPTFFIGGSKDVVAVMDPTGIARMESMLPNFLGAVVLDGVGHWVQQERPAEFNEALLGFLGRL
jgi:pimeloyl-ACP methyl ester carboxylesterase